MLAASRTKRLVAAMLDGTLIGLAIGIGLAAFVTLASAGVLKTQQSDPSSFDALNAMCVLYFPAFALAVCQWNMTATRGQTIAKKLLRMKIVTRNGQSPGFFQGVMLRSWATALLGVIPFFGLLNLLFIFGEPRRCNHDYPAGTYVIDA